MRIILQHQMYEEIILRDMHENEYDREAAIKEYNWAIKNAYEDYQQYDHSRGLYVYDEDEHNDECCSWCNIHAQMRDACMPFDEILECLEFHDDSITCENCLAFTTWYKKL